MSESSKETPGASGPKEVEIHYKKSANYKTIYADGVIGGVSPKGNIFFDFYFERAPTPEKLVYRLTEEGRLGPLLDREQRQGLERQIECGILLDVQTAVEFYRWLEKRIREFEQRKDVKLIQEQEGENDTGSKPGTK